MRLAFVADIHGNLPALQAVVRDLETQAVDQVYLVGDQISRVPWHNEVMDLICERGWPAIYGNHEWVIGRLGTTRNVDPFRDREKFSTLWWTMETLRSEHLEAIRLLPGELVIRNESCPPILVTHGVPGNPFVGILPYTLSKRAAEHLRNADETVLVLGHTHWPMDRRIGRRRVLNGGSVGLPYNGDPRAQYLILEWDGHEYRADFRAVAFDRSSLREAFERSGMLEAAGATGELHVLTALTGEPWSSDFAYWLHKLPPDEFASMETAVASYLTRHGPGRWAFGGTSP